MSKFKIGDWVHTYDEQGLVYKHQVRDNAGFIYITGRPEPFDTKDIFKTKKECLQAMKDAGIQKASLHTATVMNLEKQISDLEAKLAESERKYEGRKQFCITEIRSLTEMINNLLEENNELKQQLTEKEKEIDGLKDNWNSICDYLGDCVVKYDKEDFNGIYGEILEKVNILKRYDYKRYQNKISFAVEQLEKVKELFESCWDYKFDIGELCNKGLFYNKIEQLIAELTHRH